MQYFLTNEYVECDFLNIKSLSFQKTNLQKYEKVQSYFMNKIL